MRCKCKILPHGKLAIEYGLLNKRILEFIKVCYVIVISCYLISKADIRRWQYMPIQHRATFNEVYWADVSNIVTKAMPSFGKIINDLSIDKKYKAYLARYPFGSKIIHDGVLHIANKDGAVVPITDPSIPEQVREDLSYRTVPMGIFTHNTAEVYFEMEERIISLNLFKPGYMMGLWEALDPPTTYLAKRIWQVNAGARSMVMLPRITDVGQHEILEREFGLERSVPKSMLDHWHEFVAIANHPNFEQEWYCEIIFLSRSWFDQIGSRDKKWGEYRNYLKDLAWQQTSYWRNKVTYDIAWGILIVELNRFNAKPNPYDIDIAKHLGMQAMGVLPVLTPATNNDNGPISELQDVYTYKYGQKLYIPTIMVPTHLCKDKPIVKGYHSLRFPTLETAPKTRNHPSALHNLKQIKRVEQKFRQAVLSGKLGVEGTLIFDAVQNVEIDYFHSDIDEYDDIKSTKLMPLEDEALIYYPNKLEKMIFSDNSSFVRGCMRFSYKL